MHRIQHFQHSKLKALATITMSKDSICVIQYLQRLHDSKITSVQNMFTEKFNFLSPKNYFNYYIHCKLQTMLLPMRMISLNYSIFLYLHLAVFKLFVCLFGILRPTREFSFISSIFEYKHQDKHKAKH